MTLKVDITLNVGPCQQHFVASPDNEETNLILWMNRLQKINRHPDAEIGVSWCGRCGKVVARGQGRWWETSVEEVVEAPAPAHEVGEHGRSGPLAVQLLPDHP